MNLIHLRPWESARTFRQMMDATVMPINVAASGKDSKHEIEALLKAMQRRHARLQETQRKVDNLQTAINVARDNHGARKSRSSRKS
ncbi:MAG TPA: hypothetical protein VMH87_07845 [Pseudomonadales bacterium]|nr:hypothetical protein [Pseudomonadales bacterium]